MEEHDELADLARDLARHARWATAHGETDAPAVAPRAVALMAAMPPVTPAIVVARGADRVATPAPAPAPAPVPVLLRQDAPVTGTAQALVSTPALVPADPARLAAVQAELGACTRCKLCRGRKNLVFGVGSPRAELVFVGEGPGADEDQQGIPFVGKAGQLLTKMIEAMGYTREQVYICNVVKCRPPGNRNPEPDEIAACEPFLRAQLEAIGPKAIVALGKFAAQTLLRDSTPITRLRGRWRAYAGVKLMPTFHPAYLLRSPEEKRKAWEDLKLVLAELGREPRSTRSHVDPAPTPDAGTT